MHYFHLDASQLFSFGLKDMAGNTHNNHQSKQQTTSTSSFHLIKYLIASPILLLPTQRPSTVITRVTMTLSKRKGGHASLQGKKPGQYPYMMCSGWIKPRSRRRVFMLDRKSASRWYINLMYSLHLNFEWLQQSSPS